MILRADNWRQRRRDCLARLAGVQLHKGQHGLMMGAGGGGAWTTTADLTAALTANETGWGGYTDRTCIPASALTSGASKVRFTLGASSSATVITNAYFQRSAGASDVSYFATPVQLLFSGSAGVTIAPNTNVVTDEVVMALGGWTGSLGIYMAGASSLLKYNSLQGGFSNAYKLANDAATVVASGYTNPGTSYFIRKIEVFI